MQTVESPTTDDFHSSLRRRISRQISEPLARLYISAFESDASLIYTVQEDWSTSKLTVKYGMSADLLFTDAAHILLDVSSESASSPLFLPVPSLSAAAVVTTAECCGVDQLS